MVSVRKLLSVKSSLCKSAWVRVLYVCVRACACEKVLVCVCVRSHLCVKASLCKSLSVYNYLCERAGALKNIRVKARVRVCVCA